MTDTAVAATTEYAVSADGTRIAFERHGAGPVLVLVDGALCFRDFGPARPLAKELADRLTVVAYDRRGRGDSDATPATLDREIEDLAAVIAAVGGDAAVLGFSSGGAIAYRAAAAGVRMRAVVGYEAPWVGLRRNPDGSAKDYLGELERLVAQGRRGKAVDYFMVDMVGGPFFLPLVFRLMRKTWKRFLGVAPTLPNDARAMGAAFEVPTEELARVAVPALALAGGKSKPEMQAAQRAVAAAIPGGQVRVLHGASHQVAPATLRPVLLEFLGV